MKLQGAVLALVFCMVSCQKTETVEITETTLGSTASTTEAEAVDSETLEVAEAAPVIDPNYFQGTKRFCEFLNAWEYEVTITGDDVKISLFPGSDNEFHPNKSKATEIHTGKIVNGVLTVNRPDNCENCGPEYETSMFKYADGVFSVLSGNEYTDFNECK